MPKNPKHINWSDAVDDLEERVAKLESFAFPQQSNPYQGKDSLFEPEDADSDSSSEGSE